MAKIKVLYFINSSKPTNHDKQVAFYTGQSVCFRNVALVKPDDVAETCDAVMGLPIPAQYAGKPGVDEALSAKNANIPAVVPPVFDLKEQAEIKAEVAVEVAAAGVK